MELLPPLQARRKNPNLTISIDHSMSSLGPLALPLHNRRPGSVGLQGCKIAPSPFSGPPRVQERCRRTASITTQSPPICKDLEIPYNARKESGFTWQVRDVIAGSPSAVEWECRLAGSGYSGKMDIEVQNDEHFIAWTSIHFDDTTRFPARIKAAATALREEGFTGEFEVVADKDVLKIVRKSN